MTDLRQAAQQALEALESRYASGSLERCGDAITALEAALEQQQPAEPEPVATVTVMTQGVRRDYSFQALQKLPDGVNNLYTTPPQRKPLTDELYNELLFAVGSKYPDETRHQTALRYIKRAEMRSASPAKAAHGIKEGT